jgi:hypothetical protein
VPIGFCCSRPRIAAAGAPSNPPTRQPGTPVTSPWWLLTDSKATETLYREAIERLGRSRIAVHLSRAQFVYGEWLSRENRRKSGGRAVFGVVVYVLVALIALWRPAVGLGIAAALPVFYGSTTEGWLH